MARTVRYVVLGTKADRDFGGRRIVMADVRRASDEEMRGRRIPQLRPSREGWTEGQRRTVRLCEPMTTPLGTGVRRLGQGQWGSVEEVLEYADRHLDAATDEDVAAARRAVEGRGIPVERYRLGSESTESVDVA